jgi:hypothetical protein
VWAIARLAREDRALVDAFRVRILALHEPKAPAISAGTPPRGLWLPWLLVVTALAAVLAYRAGLINGPRLAPAALALAAAVACGGGGGGGSQIVTGPTPAAGVTTHLPLASYFAPFAARVRTRQDAQYLYVESDGMPDHAMMVGIRSWQQQVPLPQPYSGGNAWRIPLGPRLSDQPVSARTGLFRGAIALAVNGVPIFNALNNRGDDAFLAGELDEFGGHAGRADDYHYHTAPLFLGATVGPTQPIAVALDGFPLYGAAEPDGSPVRALDEYNGHPDAAAVYHYHGTRTYPYINGGMRGVVTVTDQVEPQPSLTPIRPAGVPLNGARITRHASTGPSAWTLEYELAARTYRVEYRIDGTRYTFVFTDPSGATRTEVYGR